MTDAPPAAPANAELAIDVANLSHAYLKPQRTRSKKRSHRAPKPAYMMDPALSDITFSVRPGEVFGLLGPNGSGKSTLFRILATVQGARPPAGSPAGSAKLFGIDVAQQPANARRQLGVVFQNAGLDDKLTALENMRFHGMLYGMRDPQLTQTSMAWLQTLGLADRAGEIVERFSGGMRRRVEIAKALLPGPRLLMMDEASTGLDAAVLRDIWDLLRQRVERDGLTVALTTHLMHEAEQCDRLAVLTKGRIVAIDTPAGLVGRVGGQVLEVQLARQGNDTDQATQQQVEAAIARLCPDHTPAVLWLRETARIEHADAAQWVQPLVQELGDKVRGIRVGRPTLEDAYLKLAGHRLGEEEIAN